MEFLIQLIKRTTVLEEVTNNHVPLEPLHYPLVATVADQLPLMAGVTADVQICVVDAKIDGLSQASKQSLGQIDPRAPGWTRSHFQSIILAGMLLRDEKVESFEWVFRIL